MHELRMGFAIAMGIFLGLSGWSLVFPQRPMPIIGNAGYQSASFDGCGGYKNPCEITGEIRVTPNALPIEIMTRMSPLEVQIVR